MTLIGPWRARKWSPLEEGKEDEGRKTRGKRESGRGKNGKNGLFWYGFGAVFVNESLRKSFIYELIREFVAKNSN